MSLQDVALAGILLLARAPAVVLPRDAGRLEELAAAVARAVEAPAAVPFEGPARREAAALALVAIAWHESGFAGDVVDCRRRGDHGRSVTAWQLMRPWALGGHSVEAVCASPELAARQALAVLGQHAARCSRSPWGAAFAGYASGSCGRPSRAAARQCRAWERLAHRAGLVASCATRAPVTRVPS